MSAKKKSETPSLEEAFSQMEEIIEKMESQDISLDESFALYQQGMEKLKSCNEMLDTVEKKMQILNAEGEPEEDGYQS